ncbi:serine hydrolase domain-containing protein [Flagellimonas nanhaiensis]|uniref:Class A beta-lactamase-related serine hydrolase n=1 Tax=Flagellimonas nanhaiensis TaxID=2292706 RepID=A0A371JNA4_9FLAO|nr:serine hydrolase domain-containing protein [Allomuricauda nanhaiensis]RDY58722.1 class A beta-lactamase-related serine hydrolase [Allomuricauda nanhaiensis]
MKNEFSIIKKYLYASLLFMFIYWLQSCSSDDSSNDIPQNLSAVIDDVLEKQASNRPGVAVLVRKDGDVVYQQTKGLARTSDNLSINSNTGFRIGSITKTFTALGIMKLVEQDLISLEDKVMDFIPELSDAFSSISVKQLLDHSAGLLDYIDDNNDLSTLDGVTTSQVLDLIPISGLENLLFEPGTSAEYSNTGYVFLALIIERISRMSYPSYMQTNIFAPLGMSNTFVINENEHLGDKNGNYALNFGNLIKVKGFDSLIYGPSGIVSTINDLNLFVEAILLNQIVSETTLQSMIQPSSSISWLGDYGLGWITGTGTNYWHQDANLTDSNDYWHIGGFDGYRSILSINPNLNLEIIILTNNGDASQELSYSIVRKVREYYKGN